jgi:hypothetical protein
MDRRLQNRLEFCAIENGLRPGLSAGRFSWKIQVDQPFRQSHFHAPCLEVDAAQIAFGEGDEHLAGCALHHQQRHRPGGAVHFLDLADEERSGRRNVDQHAADQVADVDLALTQRGPFGAGNSDDQPVERLKRQNRPAARAACVPQIFQGNR